MSTAANNKPVKVCFIAPKAYPLFNPVIDEVLGGSEVDLYLLATELAADAGFQVSFITADYGQNAIELIEGVTVYKSLDFSKNALSGAHRIYSVMRQADADIYMLKTASPGVPLAAVFCRLYRRVFVYRTASVCESDGSYLKEHFFLGRAFAASLRSAGAVFAQNLTDKEGLKKTIGVDAEVIPNAHHIPELSHSGRDTILWVGRSSHFKRPERFISLAEEFPNQKFVMICQRATGDDNYEKLCSRAKSVSNIEFHGRVPFHEIDGYFRRAKVFVNTSDAEGFPNTFIQAGKCAAAILSLKVDPDGFITKNRCGISCGGDWQRFVDGLKTMLQADAATEFGGNARKYVQANHDVEKIITRYKEKFIELTRSAK